MSNARTDVLQRLKGAMPAGAVGLAIVAGLVAISLTSNPPAPTMMPAPVSSSSTADGAPILTSQSIGERSDPAHVAGQASGQAGPGSSLPGLPGLPGVANNQTPGAARPAMGMEIVVKFKDDAKVKDMIDAFWRDPAAAKQRFEAFKSGKPEFAGLKLDRVTYSNELVLVDTQGGEARLPAMREIAARLNGLPDVSYAEPNMTAQPGNKPQ